MNKKPKILLVDDDADFVDVNKAVLENHGFDVVASFSAREGLGKVRFEQPDLIVLDLLMERHDAGFAFAKAVKADPVYRKIPILMLTAVAGMTGYDFSQALDGYWMKTDAYANKPIPPEELIKQVEDMLSKAAAQA